MSEALCWKYAEHGADGPSLDEVRQVLRWQDEHVLRANEIASQVAARSREALRTKAAAGAKGKPRPRGKL